MAPKAPSSPYPSYEDCTLKYEWSTVNRQVQQRYRTASLVRRSPADHGAVGHFIGTDCGTNDLHHKYGIRDLMGGRWVFGYWVNG